MVTITVVTVPPVDGATVSIGNDKTSTRRSTTNSSGKATFEWNRLNGIPYISVQKTDYVFSKSRITTEPSNVSWGSSSAWESVSLVTFGSPTKTMYALPNPRIAEAAREAERAAKELADQLRKHRNDVMSLATKSSTHAVNAATYANRVFGKVRNGNITGANADITKASESIVTASVARVAAKNINDKSNVSTYKTYLAIDRAGTDIRDANLVISSAKEAIAGYELPAEEVLPVGCTSWKTTGSPSVPSVLARSFPISISNAEWVCRTDSRVSEPVTGMGKIRIAGYEVDFPIRDGYGRVNITDKIAYSDLLSASGDNK